MIGLVAFGGMAILSIFSIAFAFGKLQDVEMKLSELAVAVYLYGSLTDYDKCYYDFLGSTKPEFDLCNPNHRQALIKWLNRWGCRQFALEYHSKASAELSKWGREFQETLPRTDTDLWCLTNEQINSYERLFDNLSERSACQRSGKNKTSNVRFGSTGAAKILFALRPKTFVPWDDPIRRKLSYPKSGKGYCRFLEDAKFKILKIGEQAMRFEIALKDLPAKLDRRKSTVPKLLDEYFWVTITRRCRLPMDERIRRWYAWSNRFGPA